jgi:hypothetical protein
MDTNRFANVHRLLRGNLGLTPLHPSRTAGGQRYCAQHCSRAFEAAVASDCREIRKPTEALQSASVSFIDGFELNRLRRGFQG